MARLSSRRLTQSNITIGKLFVRDTIIFAATYEGKTDNICLTVAATFSLNEQKSHLEDANAKNINNLLTKLVKHSLSELDYKQIGRLPKFFNPR